MKDFVHLHVHTQYSILDGQASIPRLVDKAVANGMRGMAVTDHGNMMGIKEFFNYTGRIRGKAREALQKAEATLAELKEKNEGEEAIGKAESEVARWKRVANFKAILGCEMYVAHRGKQCKEGKQDSSGWHLIVLAKNLKGYHNLVKLVSRAWVDGFYMRPRTDHEDLERYREGLIVCSACLGGEVPKKIMNDDIDGACQSIEWFKKTFGDDYYLELQRHEVTNPNIRANRETFPLQQKVNAVLIELAKKYDIKLICTNDTHFVDEENAEAHDRLICLSTGKELNDPKRMLYTKQEWFKTREEMNGIFADVPEALENTCEICEKIEHYSIDHAPIMPTFEIPVEFGTEEDYRHRFSDKELFDEFTRDENGNVIMDESEGERRERFASAGRHCEREEAGRETSRFDAALQYFISNSVHVTVGSVFAHLFHVCVEAPLQLVEAYRLAARGELLRLHKTFRVEPIGVNEARE